MDDVFAGVDVGGTTVKLGLGTTEGRILARTTIATDSHRGPEDVLKRIAEGLADLSKEIGRKPVRIGMGIPGIVDIEQGMTRYLPNLMGHWKNVPAASILSDLVKTPVKLLNDVKTATLGELFYGHGQDEGVSSFVLIAIGTGIGGGVILNRKLWVGAGGAAGEIGHQTIMPDGPRCGCGNYGCLETLASGTAISAEGMRLLLAGLAPILREMTNGDLSRVSAKTIADAAEAGDVTCRDAILLAGRYLGIAIGNLVTTLQPDLVVIGGGVSRIGDMLLNQIRKEVIHRVPIFPADSIRIEVSQLSDQAGLRGAVALAVHDVPIST